MLQAHRDASIQIKRVFGYILQFFFFKYFSPQEKLSEMWSEMCEGIHVNCPLLNIKLPVILV